MHTLTLTLTTQETTTRARKLAAAAPRDDRDLLRASQVDRVASDEIDFYFTADAEDEGAVQARAIIATWIAKLSPRDQEALALYFDPEPWPESILEEGLDYGSGYALVLSRASAFRFRKGGYRHYAVEQRANEQLRASILEHGPRALRHLTRRAEWDFATALRAYAKARGRAPSVLADLDLVSSRKEVA